MGVVYKANQLGLDRIVALKMIRAGLVSGSHARFRTEVTAVARLQHPNIVQIFEVGEAGGLPYYSLEYVAGGNLADKLAGTPQPAQATAHLVELVARAVHFAHERGIIHRDLKPANILLTPEGAPKIADFGLAKLLEGETSSLASTGEWIQGTPCYMAPEQANPRGAGRQIGPAADVYALGAILYEMVTGQPPFRSQTPLETALQVLHTEPTPPRHFQPDVPRDLETICLKCLAKEPARRFASALELAEDLRRFQAGEPIKARPVSGAERVWRWSRRNPVVASLLATLAVVVVSALILITWKWRAEAQAAAQARKEKHEADLARQEVERLSARGLVDLAVSQGDHGNIDRALLLLVKSLELVERAHDQDLERTIRLSLTAWRSQLFRRRAMLPHDDWVWAVTYSPDGKWCATASKDKTARLWDTATGEPVSPPLNHKYPVWTVAFSPDGTELWTGSGDGQTGAGEVRRWQVPTGKSLHQWNFAAEPDGRFITKLSFSKDGRTILVVSAGAAHVCTLVPGKENNGPASCRVLQHPNGVITAALSPDGKTALTGGADGTARLWDTATGEPVGQALDHRPKDGVCQIVAAAFSPDGELVLTGTQVIDVQKKRFAGGEVRLWRAKTGAPVGKPWSHPGPLKTVVFSPDGTRALTGCIALTKSTDPAQKKPEGFSGEAKLWDVATGDPINQPLRQSKPIWAVAFSPNGRILLTGSEGGDVQFWSAATGLPLFTFQNQLGNVNSVAFSPDGKTALTSRTYEKASAMLWEVPSGLGEVVPFVRAPGAHAFAFAPNGANLVTGGADGKVRWWDLAKKKETHFPSRHRHGVFALAFSPDGKILASGGPDANIQLWDAATGKPLPKPLGPHEGALAMAFSPDSKTLLTGGHMSKTVLWDVASRRPLGPPLSHSNWVRALAFYPDGTKYVVGTDHGTIQAWDTVKGKPVGAPMRHQRGVNALAFSPDGKILASGGDDDVASLWDAATSLPLRAPLQHDGPVRSVAFSRDGTILLTGTENRSARIWDVATGLRIGPLLAHPGPVLATFNPVRRNIATLAQDGLLRLWDVPLPATGNSFDIKDWAQALTGKELTDSGVLQELDRPTLARLRQKVKDRAFSSSE
jgi:WD40 repeat protein